MSDNKNKTEMFNVMRHCAEPVSLAEIRGLLSFAVNERTLRRWLVAAVEAGDILRTGEKRSTRYQFVQKDVTSNLAFLKGKSASERDRTIKQLRDLWTHTSTALEGNTLTLGDTHFLLEEGITVSGKPIGEHQEVMGHATALELLYRALDKPVNDELCFELHKVLTTQEWDIYKPYGAWKNESNFANTVGADDKPVHLEYAKPQYVAKLMSEFFTELARLSTTEVTLQNAHVAYAKIHAGFASVHPFWDGNGRIARLLANVVMLRAGLPPILIPVERRKEYIQFLAAYQISSGALTPITGVWPDESKLEAFANFCQECYQTTLDIVNPV